MYPYELFWGIDLYVVFIVVGVIAAMVFLRIFADKTKMPSKLFNFVLVAALIGIVVGYAIAVLFQDVYHYLATGQWDWTAGATFYGGLIGGAAGFLLFYFVAGHFVFKDKTHIREFNNVLCCAMPCVVVAHGFGRIGCLMDGCCYGKITDQWYGIMMYSDGAWNKRVPTQLFEALFLFALFAVLAYLLVKRNNRYTVSVYLIAYGVWRFLIEFIRDDAARGSSGIPGLWPSQVTAIIMVIAGVAYMLLYKYLLKGALARVGTGEA